MLEPLSGDGTLDSHTISLFRSFIWEYFRDHGRSFPWRDTRDPYSILVSEMMLQQTQTERVLPKYLQFTDVYPDIPCLAAAQFRDVYPLWQGLGYNRRCLALITIAGRCMDAYGGKIPNCSQALLSFPSVGPATAAALKAFAWGEPSLYLETNIRRVLLHVWFHRETDVSDRRLMDALAQVMDRDDPRRWYYAMMDYGVHLRKAIPNPNTRSRHYVRQKPFRDSDREIRGMILRELSGSGSATLQELAGRINIPLRRIEYTVGSLSHDGLVACENPQDNPPRFRLA